MIEKQSYQEPFSEVDKRKDDEMEIDLMAIFIRLLLFVEYYAKLLEWE